MRPLHLQAGIVQEAIRDHIDSCGSKIASVLFIKNTTGELRRMNFNRKAMAPIAGTERGKAWAEKVAESNPNLVRVSEITRDGLRWKTIDLDTVLTVKAGGKVTRYRDVERIARGVYELVPIVTIRIGVEESQS